MLDALKNIQLPPRFIQSISELMEVAEVIFGAKSGAQKKEWVKNAALDLARKIDIPVLPEAIERPIEEMIIDLVIEVLWAMLFGEDGLLSGEMSMDADLEMVPVRKPIFSRRLARRRLARG
ncbi:MAG: hypothetical protein ACI8RZ_001469 [Myxococcota bacterium]|jgi:hypothetical protein